MISLSSQSEFRTLSETELDAVSGGMRSLVNDPGYNGPKLKTVSGVGANDTIDSGHGFDPNNLPSGGPGSGPWGN
jgi:bacteriocin-like protein